MSMKETRNEAIARNKREMRIDIAHARERLSLVEVAEVIRDALKPEEVESLIRFLSSNRYEDR